MKSLIIVLALAGSTAAYGNENLFVNAAMFYANETAKYEDAERDQTSLYYQLGVGVGLSSGLLLGGKYLQLDEDAKSDGDKSANVLSAFGLSFGYMHASGMGFTATYLFEPKREMQGGGEVTATWSGGNGNVIDLGYYFDNGGWAIGPQLSIVNATFEKVESNGQEVELDAPYTETFTYPYVSLFFYF